MSDVQSLPEIMTIHDLIAVRAYEIWESHGSPGGHDVEHWLQAESEIVESRAKNEPPTKEAMSKTFETRKAA